MFITFKNSAFVALLIVNEVTERVEKVFGHAGNLPVCAKLNR